MEEQKYSDQKNFNLLQIQNSLCLAEFSNANIGLKRINLLHFQSYKSSVLNVLSQPRRLLVASNKKLEYVGSNYESEASQVTSSRLKVAIYKKSTQEIKFYDVDLFHLKPLLKCKLERSLIVKSWTEQSEELAIAFGSKTRKRAITSRLKYQSIGNDSMNQFLNQPSLLMENTNVAATEKCKQESEVIPPQNKNAISVNEVYNIYDIISKEDYSNLDSEADNFLNATFENIQLWKNEEKFCTFIIYYLESRFQSLPCHNAKLLCYIHYMICFLKKGYKDWKKKDPVPEVPEPFKKSIMNRYVLNRSMPQRMKDKLLADMMVLVLTINNYFVDANILARSTRVSLKQLTLVAYALGCHVSEKRTQDSKLIELKLPLYKYEPRAFKRK